PIAGSPPSTATSQPPATMAATRDSIADALDTLLNPDRTFTLEAASRLQLSADAAAGRTDALAPVMMTPSFPQPMYEPLRDLFGQLLLPGVEGIPDNSVMPFRVDAGFIESFMAGLNDEMSRELLWREFPTDLRGTYFRQFWDVSGQLAADAAEAD